MLLIHHTIHDGGRERGSSSLRGGLDTLISLQLSRGRLRLTCGKQKDGSPFDPVSIRLVPMVGSCVVEVVRGEPEKPGSAIAGNELSILISLNSLSLGGARVSIPALLKSSGVAESSFYRSLNKLHVTGYVVWSGRGKRSDVTLSDSGKSTLLALKSQVAATVSSGDADLISHESSPPFGGRRERNRPSHLPEGA